MSRTHWKGKLGRIKCIKTEHKPKKTWCQTCGSGTFTPGKRLHTKLMPPQKLLVILGDVWKSWKHAGSNLDIRLSWVKQCHKPSPKSRLLYVVMVTIPSRLGGKHGIVLPTENSKITPPLAAAMIVIKIIFSSLTFRNFVNTWFAFNIFNVQPIRCLRTDGVVQPIRLLFKCHMSNHGKHVQHSDSKHHNKFLPRCPFSWLIMGLQNSLSWK